MSELHSKSLCLYRDLLRAISYFPDQFARAAIHKQIIYRFRKAKGRFSRKEAKSLQMGYRSAWKSQESNSKISERIASGKQRLGVLTRAARGEPECFLKVLMLAYGRVGRRRRELIRTLIEDDPENTPGDSQALLAMIDDDSNLERLLEDRDHRAGPKFNAFLKSQKTCQNKDVRGTIKELEPKIPELNIWGRPFPRKREATIKKNWWALVLHKLLPPVPRDEFERLKGLSTGILPLQLLISRRKSAIPLNTDSRMINTSDWINILKSPLKKIDESQIDMIKCTHQGLEKEKEKEKEEENTLFYPSKVCDHKLIRSHRSMRRLYGKVWALTATMSQNKSTGQWIVEWGRGSSRYLAGEVTQPCSSDLELFEGLENLTQ